MGGSSQGVIRGIFVTLSRGSSAMHPCGRAEPDLLFYRLNGTVEIEITYSRSWTTMFTLLEHVI